MPMPVFDPEVVHQCSMECLGLPKPQMFDVFARSLAKHYPRTLDPRQPWIYSIAGGAMIQMKLYYASMTEYIMIWGTPIGSEGHSGRHFTGFWDTVIDGEMWYYGEGEFEKKLYKPGDRVYVGPGQARAMNFTDGVWAVEYARGFIPLSMPFGIAEEVLICHDFLTATQTFSLYTDLVARAYGHKYARLRPLTVPVSRLAYKATRALVPSPEVSKIPRENIRWFQRKT
jgi:ERG2 and Sigma1 receptor like protein